MKKSVLLCFIYCVSVCFCMAQRAEALFEEASKTYEKANGISAQFTMNIQSQKQGSLESFEGTIQMKGDKFVLITPDTRTWYDGTTQWTYIVSTDEVYPTTPSGDDLQFVNPMILLRTYKTGFNLTYQGESTAETGKPVYDLQLTSQGKSDVERIDIQIEKATSFPVRMTVYMKNGIRNLIRISQMLTGVNQPDSFFVFNPTDYPNAIEIDLR